MIKHEVQFKYEIVIVIDTLKKKLNLIIPKHLHHLRRYHNERVLQGHPYLGTVKIYSGVLT